MDNKEWLKLAQDAYQDSTTFLDNHYRRQWENNIRLYQNQHPLGSKYNTELFQRRSSIFRPKTRSAAQKFEAAVSNAYFSTKDIVNIFPRNPRDEHQIASAKINTNLLEYRLEKTVPWFKICLGAAQEAWKMGVVVSYQSWEYEEDSNGRVKKDTPTIELIPPENIRLDKAANWVDPIGTSPFIIHKIPMYVSDVKKRLNKLNIKTNQPEWVLEKEEDLYTAVSSFQDSIRIAREKSKADPKAETNIISDFDIVWIHQNIINKDNIDYVYYTLDTIALLSKPVKLESIYAHGERPYVIGSCLIETFKTLPSGIPEITQNIQEEINDIANTRLDNVKLVLNKRYFAKRGRNVDFRSLLRNIPGSITMMDDPVGDVQVVSTPDITASSYAEQDRLNADYDELAGNFSPGSVQTNRRMNETVGGLSLLSSGAGQIIEHYIKVFNETWVEPVLAQLILLEQQYETDETILALAANEELERLYQQFGQTPQLDDLLRQELTLSVNVGISSTNPQVKVEKFLFAMNAIGQILSSPIANTLEIKSIIDEIFGLLGYKDAMRFFKNLSGDSDPRIQALLEQIAELTNIIEQKQIEQQAKLQIEEAKLQLKAEEIKIKSVEAEANVVQSQIENENILAEAQKKNAETQRLLAGVEEQLKIGELQLKAAEMENKKQIDLLSNKTQRDKIVADLMRTREELEGKLKITLANAKSPSEFSLGDKKSE